MKLNIWTELATHVTKLNLVTKIESLKFWPTAVLMHNIQKCGKINFDADQRSSEKTKKKWVRKQVFKLSIEKIWNWRQKQSPFKLKSPILMDVFLYKIARFVQNEEKFAPFCPWERRSRKKCFPVLNLKKRFRRKKNSPFLTWGERSSRKRFSPQSGRGDFAKKNLSSVLLKTVVVMEKNVLQV